MKHDKHMDKTDKRIKELEKKAWENMTGEEVMNHLSKEEAEEYSRLVYT